MFKKHDKVILPANEEEGWVEEIGIITAVQDQEKYPGMYLVQVIETPKEMDDNDDGIREVHETGMVLSNKRTKAEKLKDFAEIYGGKNGRLVNSILNHGNRTGRNMQIFSARRAGKTTFANYWLQAQKARQVSTMADYIDQDLKATNLLIQMNYAAVEQRVLAHFMKCGTACPFIKILFPENIGE